MARDALEQVRLLTGDHEFAWSFGGGTAMMLQIGHRESHDVDIFLDDPQLLEFLNPEKVDLRLDIPPTATTGDGARFRKFVFDAVGEIDFIAAGALTEHPFTDLNVAGKPTRLDSIVEIVVKKIYHRGRAAQARDIFDIAAAAGVAGNEIMVALRRYPDRVVETLDQINRLNPDFVAHTIGQLMIRPGYERLVPASHGIVRELLKDVLS